MKKLPAVFFIVFILSCGTKKKIGQEEEFQPGYNLPEVFKLTTDTQDAVFYIATGWSGNAGTGMPVIEQGTQDPKLLNGDLICFDGDYSETVLKKLPACVSGQPEIKVAARIYLTRGSGNSPIDPEYGEKTYTYYEAKVVQLGAIYVKSDPCFHPFK
jgi:hypothetical protein